MNIQKNDIICYLPTSKLSNIIAYFSGKYSHIAVAMNNELEVSSCFKKDVYTDKINFSYPFDIYRLKPAYQKQFNETEAWTFVKYALKFGVEYDKWGLACFLLDKPFFNSPSKYYCSEFVNEMFISGDIILRPDKPDWKTSPTDLANSNKLECGDRFNPALDNWKFI
jgi:hypothetical protein